MKVCRGACHGEDRENFSGGGRLVREDEVVAGFGLSQQRIEDGKGFLHYGYFRVEL